MIDSEPIVIETISPELKASLDQQSYGVLIENAQRKIMFCNAAIRLLFGIDLNDDSIIGGCCQEAASALSPCFADPKSFLNFIHDAINSRKKMRSQAMVMNSYTLVEINYLPIVQGTAVVGSAWIYAKK